jgi:hypothetical protein
MHKIYKELGMDRFSSFAQVLENPFLALRFRQDPQERQFILEEHGFNAQETQAICDSITANDEHQIAKIFGHEQGQYLFVVVIIDAMALPDSSLAIAK